jgi:hypothetical protein
VTIFLLVPALVFPYWGCGHDVGFDDSWNWTYLVLDKVHCVVVVVGFKPYASVPCSKDVVGVVQCHARRRVLWQILQIVYKVIRVLWTYLHKKQI